MPVYLLHGFRWPRQDIRIHIIMQDLEDAAAEWLVGPTTSALLHENLTELFPSAMENLPNLRFIEQYDPEDMSVEAGPQPYAYVADVVHEIKLGADVDELRQGINADQWDALLELRDKLANEAKVGWYVVYCGDEERLVPSEDGGEDDYTALPALPGSTRSQQSAWTDSQIQTPSPDPPMRTLASQSPRKTSIGTRESGNSPAASRKSQSIGSPVLSRQDSDSVEKPQQRGLKKLLGSISRRK